MPRRSYVYMAASAILVLATGQCLAVEKQALDDMVQLFETDPAAAFEAAEALFDEAFRAGDLAGMAAIITPVGDRSYRLDCPRVADDMIAAATPVAEANGRWDVLADLHNARAWVSWRLMAGGAASFMGLRAVHFSELAETASRRAGKPVTNSDGGEGRRHWGGFLDQRIGEWRRSCPAHAQLLEQAARAVTSGRDAEALEALGRIVDGVVAAPSDEGYQALIGVSHMLWVAGGETLVAPLRELAEGWQAHRSDIMRLLTSSLSRTWRGRPDPLYDTLCWASEELYRTGEADTGGVSFICKLLALKRVQEADRLTQRYLQRILEHEACDLGAAAAIHSMTPPETRRALFGVSLEFNRRYNVGLRPAGEWLWAGVVGNAPPDERELWAFETAQQLLSTGMQFGDPQSRACGASEAAKLFEQANRADLAAQCRTLAESLATTDPAQLFECAVLSSRALAADRKWNDVLGQLEPAVVDRPPSIELIQAGLLMIQAYTALGRDADADVWMEKAWRLLAEVPMAPAMRADVLITMAELCVPAGR